MGKAAGKEKFVTVPVRGACGFRRTFERQIEPLQFSYAPLCVAAVFWFHNVYYNLLKEESQVFLCQGANQAVVGVDDGLRQLFFCSLEFKDFFLDGIADDHPVCKNLARLAEPVCAVDRLGLDGRIPPWIQQKDVFRCRQVKPKSTCFQTHKE